MLLRKGTLNALVLALILLCWIVLGIAFIFFRIPGSNNTEQFAGEKEESADVNQVAIVSMMREPVDVDAWLSYHRSVGVTRFYIRLEVYSSDETNMDKVAKLLGSLPYVHLQLARYNDNAESTRPIEGMDDSYNMGDGMSLSGSQVPGLSQMQRQRMWLQESIMAALADGMQWLIHIDSDELLKPNDGLSVGEAIAQDVRRASADAGKSFAAVQTMSMRNIEAIYENDKLDEKEPQCFKHSGMRDCVADGTCASYGNGKGIGRVTSGLREFGVHRFRFEKQTADDTDDDDIGPEMNSMVVVHYESCDFKKYVKKFMALSDTETATFPFDYYNDSIAVARNPVCKEKQNMSDKCIKLFQNVYTKYRIADR